MNSVKKFDLYAEGRPYGTFDVQQLVIPLHPCWTELHATGKATWSQALDFSGGKHDAILAAASGLSVRDFRLLRPYQQTSEQQQQLIQVAQEHFDRFRGEMARISVDLKASSAPKLVLIQSVDVERDGALEIIGTAVIPIVPVDVGDYRWSELYITIIARPNSIDRPLALLRPSTVQYQAQAVDLRGGGSADLLFHSENHLLYTVYSLQGGSFVQVLKEDPRYYC